MTLRALLERLHLMKPRPEGLEMAAVACTGRDGQVSRRAFIGLMGTALAGLAIDPEQLLWMPGEKRIVLPTPEQLAEFGGNRFVSPAWINRQVLRYMERNLAMAGRINRRWDDRFYRAGDTVRVRVPRRFEVRANAPIGPIHDDLEVKTVDQYAIEVSFDKVQETARKRGLDAVEVEFVRPIADKLTFEVDTFVGELPLPPEGSVGHAEILRTDYASVRNMVYAGLPEEGKPTPLLMRFDVQGFRSTDRRRA